MTVGRGLETQANLIWETSLVDHQPISYKNYGNKQKAEYILGAYLTITTRKLEFLLNLVALFKQRKDYTVKILKVSDPLRKGLQRTFFLERELIPWYWSLL